MVGGIRMELTPMRVTAPAGQTAVFVCAYFSTERLEIDLIAVNLCHANTTANAVMGPAIKDVLDRFPWGSRRTLTVVVDQHLREVLCRVTDSQGRVRGELSATIQPAGSTLSQATTNHLKQCSSFSHSLTRFVALFCLTKSLT